MIVERVMAGHAVIPYKGGVGNRDQGKPLGQPYRYGAASMHAVERVYAAMADWESAQVSGNRRD